MKYRPKNVFIIVLLTFAVGIFFVLATSQTCGAKNHTQPNEDNPLLDRLLLIGSVAGAAVILVLVATQIRWTWRGKAGADGRTAKRKAVSAGIMAFKCTKCGRVFKRELTEECTLACPLCGNVWQWPAPIELTPLEDRMLAFGLDPGKPRANLTFATRVISRWSKSFAERILVAGKYLEEGEMLCFCEKCAEIHVTKRRNKGLWGVCAECKSALLIW
jgi:hypothetical protein